MSHFVVETLKQIPVDQQRVELVERELATLDNFTARLARGELPMW